MIHSTVDAPTFRAHCDVCGVTGDRYGSKAYLLRGERSQGWRFRRAWPAFWRWRATCAKCAVKNRDAGSVQRL